MVIPGGHKANVDYRTTLERPDGPGSMEGVLGAIPLYMEAGDVRQPTAYLEAIVLGTRGALIV